MTPRRLSAWILPSALCLLGWAGAARAQHCGWGCGYGHGHGAGSPWHIDNCATIPRRAQPAPPGTYVNRWTHLQETKAEMDDFVLYRHMWHRGGVELGPLGRYQLDMISNRLPGVPFPVVIETSLDDRLDEARREVVLTLLQRRGFEDATRVIVAFPIAEGLSGEEAPRIAQFYYVGGGIGGGGIGGLGSFGGFGGFGFGGFRGF
jgi:hypothetical protein